MKIYWLGHSSFLIDCGGLRIVTDPYDESVGYKMQRVKADAVTCSHSHGDHACLRNCEGDYKLVNREGETDIDGVKIIGTPCFHDGRQGALRGVSILYKFTCGGVTVCHTGDIGEACSDKTAGKIGRADVLLIPVGGYYTIDALQAKEYVDAVKPSIVIPMHYKTADCVYPISPVSDFTRLFAADCIMRGNELNITAESLNAGKVKVFVPSICRV